MSAIWGAALAGGGAGLGVAMPLGAIGALLLRESVVGGWRVGAAAAAGVATVDLVYCAVATAAGTMLVRVIDGYRGAFLIASGMLILGIGVRQLVLGFRRPAPGDELPLPRGSARAAYGRFVGLTAINPITLVYFVALGGAVSAPGASWAAPVVFVVAAGVASLAWQLLLAAAGAAFRGVVGPGSVRAVGMVASVIVLGLGAGVLVTGAQALAGA